MKLDWVPARVGVVRVVFEGSFQELGRVAVVGTPVSASREDDCPLLCARRFVSNPGGGFPDPELCRSGNYSRRGLDRFPVGDSAGG